MDFPVELLELANELQESAPKGLEDPKAWMKRAGDFANACMINGRLSPQLLTVIPLREHGDFIHHVKAIKAASGSYNAGLRPNIDIGLGFVIKVLNREVRAESKPLFSVASIPQLTAKLTFVQKRLFDEVWNYFIATGKAYPIRSLPHIIGKQSIQDAFEGLNGSLIYETSEQGDRCVTLTAYGALLTGYGITLVGFLVRLLELVKELYENDNLIKTINRNQIQERLGISDAETQLLFSLLKLLLPPGMPIHLSGWALDGSSWTVGIKDEIFGLYRADDIVMYLDGLLSAGYRSDEPYSYDDRLRRELQNSTLLNPQPGTLPATGNQHLEKGLPSYINLSRLEELKKTKNPLFDCTRLVCMCEELNECASRGNAHAVIMLTRAILDHVPPAFGCGSFAEVASNYKGGGASFKKSIERLENHSRKVADRLLHMPIRDKEVAPNMHEVSFAPELETTLAELCRLLK